MKAIWMACMSVLLSLLVGALGCAAPAPTPTSAPAPAPAPSPTSSPAAKPTVPPAPAPTPTIPSAPTPIELKFVLANPPSHFLTTDVANPIRDEIGKRTAGRVKVTVYAGEVLGKAVDFYDMTAKGAVDISMHVLGLTPGRFPLSTVVELPFAAPSSELATTAAWEIYKQGYLDKEYADVKVLGLHASAPLYLFFAKKHPLTLAELNGLKMRTSGGYVSEVLKVAGIVPVQLSAGDIYLALQKGTIDGTPWPYAGVAGRNLQEVTKSVAEIGIASTASSLIMSKSTWSKLPKDIQDIIAMVGNESGKWIADGYVKYDKQGRDLCVKAGADAYAFPEKERDKWVQASLPIWKAWVDDMKAKGLPGKEVQDFYVNYLRSKGVVLSFQP